MSILASVAASFRHWGCEIQTTSPTTHVFSICRKYWLIRQLQESCTLSTAAKQESSMYSTVYLLSSQVMVMVNEIDTPEGGEE